jgi:hypothetical protein
VIGKVLIAAEKIPAHRLAPNHRFAEVITITVRQLGVRRMRSVIVARP